MLTYSLICLAAIHKLTKCYLQKRIPAEFRGLEYQILFVAKIVEMKSFNFPEASVYKNDLCIVFQWTYASSVVSKMAGMAFGKKVALAMLGTTAGGAAGKTNQSL